MFHVVILENKNDSDQFIPKMVVPISFPKVLYPSIFPIIQDHHYNEDHEKVRHQFQNSCCKRNIEEYYSVQYFEIINESKKNFNIIDTFPDRIRLRWKCTSLINETLSAAREICLVPLDAIRGTVHTVRGNTAAPVMKMIPKMQDFTRGTTAP